MNNINKNNNEEITLRDLKLFLYRFLIGVERTFSFFLNLFKKKWINFILLMILGGAFGASVHYMMRDTYSAQMTISYYELHNKIYGDMISKLDGLLKNKNYNRVSELLKLDVKDCKSLKKIEAFNARNEPLFEDLSYKKSPIIIKAKLKSTRLAGKLQNAIIRYLESNRFVSSRRELQTKNLKYELKYVTDKIKVIDGFLANPDLISGGSKKADSENGTIADLLEKSRELFSRKLDIESTLEIDRKIEVIDDAVLIQHKTYGNLPKMITIGGIVLLFIGFIYLGASEYKKSVAEEFEGVV